MMAARAATWHAKPRVRAGRQILAGEIPIKGRAIEQQLGRNYKRYENLQGILSSTEWAVARAVLRRLRHGMREALDFYELAISMEALRSRDAQVWPLSNEMNRLQRHLRRAWDLDIIAQKEMHYNSLETLYQYATDRLGVQPPLVGYFVSATLVAGRERQHEQALADFDQLSTEGKKESLISILPAMAFVEKWDALFEMIRQHTALPTYAVNRVLQQAFTNKHFSKGLKIYESLRSQGASGNSTTIGILVKIYQGLGEPRLALQTAQLCTDRGIKLNMSALEAVCISAREIGETHWSEWAIQCMIDRANASDGNAWQEAVHHLVRMGLCEEALKLDEALRNRGRYNIQPWMRNSPLKLEHCADIVKALYAVGRHEKAVSMLAYMKDHNMTPLSRTRKLMKRSDEILEDPDLHVEDT